MLIAATDYLAADKIVMYCFVIVVLGEGNYFLLILSSDVFITSKSFRHTLCPVYIDKSNLHHLRLIQAHLVNHYVDVDWTVHLRGFVFVL